MARGREPRAGRRAEAMEKEGYYIAVGAFVVLAVGLLVLFVAIISGRQATAETQRYEVRFTGSVAGLDVGGEVRYLGVKVGKVASIHLVPDKPREVSVIIEVKKEVPIYGNTIAKLQLQGITGISFVELRKEGPGREPLPPPPPGELPRIRAADSDLEKLARSLPDLFDAAEALVDRATDLLNDQNLNNFTTLMRELAVTSHELPGLVRQVDATFAEYARAAHEVRPDLVAVLKRLNQVSEELEAMTRRTEALYAHNSAALNATLGNSTQNMARLLEEGRVLVGALRRLTRKLEENPALLITRPRPQGVEIAP